MSDPIGTIARLYASTHHLSPDEAQAALAQRLTALEKEAWEALKGDTRKFRGLLNRRGAAAAASLQKSDGKTILAFLENLKAAMACGDVTRAVLAAIGLGEATTWLNMRALAPITERGLKIGLGGCRAARKLHGSPEDLRKRRLEKEARYTAEVQKIRAHSPAMSLNRACQVAADRLKISAKTVRRHIKKIPK